MKILDLSAGYRHIWFNPKHPCVTFVDRRAEVSPDLICDSRSLPIADDAAYDLVVFDPPHANLGVNGRMTKQYGHSTVEDMLSTVRGSAREAARVARPNALMAFKWNDASRTLEEILPLLEGWEPLFGHGMRKPGRHKTQTYWVMLRRRP